MLLPRFSLALLPNLEEERQILPMAGSSQQTSRGDYPGELQSNMLLSIHMTYSTTTVLEVVTTYAEVLT